MRNFLTLTILCFLTFASTLTAQNPSDIKRYLYLSTPDAAQVEGQADGAGILIFDIDDGHKLVRRIDIPIFEEGLRGFAANLETHSAYFSTQHPRIGAFDLETDQITWQQTYTLGSHRSSVTLDGNSHRIWLKADSNIMRYVVEKGFIAIDGISLTVVNVADDGFSVAVIPYTNEHTTLGSREPGDAVNIEVDITAKYVEQFTLPHLEKQKTT